MSLRKHSQRCSFSVISTTKREKNVRKWLSFAWLEDEVEQHKNNNDYSRVTSMYIQLKKFFFFFSFVRTDEQKKKLKNSFKCLLTEDRIAFLCQYICAKKLSMKREEKKIKSYSSIDQNRVKRYIHLIITWRLKRNRKKSPLSSTIYTRCIMYDVKYRNQ